MNSSKQKNKRNSQTDFFFPILIVVCAVAFCIWHNINSMNYITSSNAVVEGKLIQVYSRISGPVTHLNVEENQEVKKGDVLLEIDPKDYEEKLKIVQFNLKQARTKLYEYELENKEKLQKNPQIFNTNKSLHRYGFSRNDFGEYAPGLIPEPEPDKSTLTKDSDLKIAKEKEKQEKERLAKEQKNLPVIKYINPDSGAEENINEDEIDPQKLEDDIRKFEAQIEQMKLDMSYSKIYAPQDGIISVINIPEGSFVNPGEQLISIIPKKVWINATYPSSQLDNLAIGQPVIVKISKYRGRKFKAVVDDFMDKNSEQNSMIPVRIMFVEDYSNYDIQPGTTVTTMIKIR